MFTHTYAHFNQYITIILPTSCVGTWKKKSNHNNPYCRCVFTASRTFSKNLSNIHTLNFKTGGFDMVDAFNPCNLSSISLNLENRDLSEIQ